MKAGRGGGSGTDVLETPCLLCFAFWVAVARSSGVLKAAGAGFAGLGVGSTAAGAEVGLQGAFFLAPQQQQPEQ